MINLQDPQKLYLHIWKDNDYYLVMCKSECYYRTKSLSEALYLRDVLVDNEWDINSILDLNDENNPYLNLTLPKFIKRSPGYVSGLIDNQYSNIYHRLNPFEEYYIRKTINHKRYDFGSYHTLTEALLVRSELQKVNWDKSYLNWIQSKIKDLIQLD